MYEISHNLIDGIGEKQWLNDQKLQGQDTRSPATLMDGHINY
jgi:hypothetical protein